jgi:carbon monoxide dehydrogenase subunit G
MTVFESKVIIKKPLQEVYLFLANMNNHERLMPDNISNWSSTEDTAQFSIKNMGNLALRVSNRIENKNILIEPASDAPFKTAINWKLSESDQNATEATVTISAELNMMLKMMAGGMLQKLADHQGQSLQKVMG